ncbi:MAG: ABC transporter permease [Actinomycetota bacterium]
MSLAAPSGFIHDFTTVAGRALRSIPREPEAVMPSLIIPIFWYVINVGTLQDIAPADVDFKSFQIATAIIFAVSGVSRANTVVTDIQSGYLDKMLVTPIRRAALLLGMMAADIALVIALATLVCIMGFILGVGFTTGVGGFLTFIAIAAAWGLAFTGFPYFVALKTGNPAAVNSTFLIFFPFAFLTSTFLPLDALSSWLQDVARFNPVTYVLDGLRSLQTTGWETTELAQAAGAIAVFGAITFTMCFRALAQRVAID